MSEAFIEAMKVRRTNYNISDKSPISDEKIKHIVEQCVLHTPSAFNTQTGRAVVLLGEQHKKWWDIVKQEYLKILGDNEEQKAFYDGKIDKEYKAGYGTVAIFEDVSIIDAMMAKMPPIAHCFPIWSGNSTGMLHYTVWTTLCNEGLGASLQHYGDYSKDMTPALAKEFDLPSSWKSTGMIPFGVPTAAPGNAKHPKTFEPIEQRVYVRS